MFDLKDVTVCFQSESNILAVDHVSLSMEEGSKTAIIGETGSGKSVLLLAILGLLPKMLLSAETFFWMEKIC